MNLPHKFSVFFRCLLLCAILFSGSLLPSASFAQSQNDSCQLAKAALKTATSANACLRVDRDKVCYGYRTISTSPRQSRFNRLNDQVKITDIQRLDTYGNGVAIMSVKGSGGKEVKIVAFGRVRMSPRNNVSYTVRFDPVSLDAGGRLCQKTPSGIMLQTRKGEQGQISINGVTIRMRSTVFINFDALTRASLSLSANDDIVQLMAQYDDAWITTLRDNRSNRLSQVLAGSLLNSDVQSFNDNRRNSCYWNTQIMTPAEVVAIEPTSPTTAKVYVNKNWDLDLICSGQKQGDSDGPYVGVYIVELQNGAWRIIERKLHNIPEIEIPAPPTSGDVDLMAITNIEGSVEVESLGQQITLEPGQKVLVTLSNDQPVDISAVSENPEIFASPIIPWLATAPEGLPAVNNALVNNEPVTGVLATVTGYYAQTARQAEGGGFLTCDQLVVTNGDSALINELLALINTGSSFDEQNADGQLVVNLNLQSLPPGDQLLLQSATSNRPVTLSVSRRALETLNGGIPDPCESAIDILAIQGTVEPPSPTALLPAPLYFIEETTQQIFRMEPDGRTMTQITSESPGAQISDGAPTPPVHGFDVSPLDGSLVYVNDNDLIQTDSRGANRVVSVIGGSIGSMRAVSDLSDPLFSPDGNTIAFVFTGIAVMPTTPGGQFEVILPHEPIAEDPYDPQSYRFHTPVSWSPNGKYLIVTSFNPMALSARVINLSTGENIDLPIDGRINGMLPTLSSLAWSNDGETIYNGSNVLGESARGIVQLPGLSLIEPGTGNQTGLLTVPDDGQPHQVPFIQAPRITADNQLFFFADFTSEIALSKEITLSDLLFSLPFPSSYGLYRMDPDTNYIESIDTTTFGAISEARWAKDDSGAVAVVDGQLIWISKDGQSISLGVRAHSPKWGVN